MLILYQSGGAGDASAKEVIVSTRAFTDFKFDHENEILIIGAGSLWSEYHEQMRKVAPEYAGKYYTRLFSLVILLD